MWNPFKKSKKVVESVSLESQIEKAVSMFTTAITQLETVKSESVKDRERNNSRISRLEADNARLSGLESIIDSKLEILKNRHNKYEWL